MDKYLISIIVPVYNAEKYLDRAVESVINQTYRNIEIVLVDDGAKDNSPAMCDEWVKKDSRIKVVHKENGGLVSAWKRGVTESAGEYLCFVDSDDWIDADMIEKLSEHLTGIDSEIISSDYCIERKTDSGFTQEYVYQKLAPGDYDRESIEKDIIPDLLGNENRFVTVSRCMKLFSRKLITNNMRYASEELKMGEDMSITLPALLDCSHLTVLDHKAFYHYLYVTESMVHKYDNSMYDSIKMLTDIIKNMLTEKGYDSLSEALNREKIFLLLLCVKNESRGNPQKYRSNIIDISKDNEELIKNTKVNISNKANILLYRALRSPNWVNLSILRLAMIVYYR